MHWSTAFRLVLISDSIVFVLKIALPVYLIVLGADLKQQYDEQEKTDSSSVTVLLAILCFIGGSLMLICIFLRFLTNWCEHRNEKYKSSDPNSSKRCSKSCCCSGCWFVLCIVHIVIDGVLIGTEWTEGGWLRKIAISSLFWNIFILGAMMGLKFYQQKPTHQRDEEITEKINVGLK